MISQIINLSNEKTFKFYKEKYDYEVPFLGGVYGLEIRNSPNELLNLNDKKNSSIFKRKNNLLILGSFSDFIEKSNSASLNQILESEIIKSVKNYNQIEKSVYKIGNKNFNFNNSFVMGILNVTPDSFSDGGQFTDEEQSLDYALQMIEYGADIIDVGGESTRPGSESVSVEEELNRVVPIISRINKVNPEAIISIDTTKPEVASEALNNGATIVNDISGGTFSPEIFDIVKKNDATIVIMHMKGKPKTMQENPRYEDVVAEVYDYLSEQTEIAAKKGINKIFIDPGIGFGKSIADNLSLIERLEDFRSLGYPILIGLSRKSFIGNILNLPVKNRDNATNALNSIALCNGAKVIRTHNVSQAVQTCKLFNSIRTN